MAMPSQLDYRPGGFTPSLGSVYALLIPCGAGLATDQVNGESIQHCHRDAARAARNTGTGCWLWPRATRSECRIHEPRGYCCRSEVRRIVCTGSWSLYPLAGCDRCAHEGASRSAPDFCSLHRGTPKQPRVPGGAGCVPTHRSLVHLSELGRDAFAGSEVKFLDRNRWAKALVA